MQVLKQKAFQPFQHAADHNAFCDVIYHNWSDSFPRNAQVPISEEEFQTIVRKFWAHRRTAITYRCKEYMLGRHRTWKVLNLVLI
jgi:hypothetical protein